MNETLDQRREQFLNRVSEAKAVFDSLAVRCPEFQRARTKRKLMRELARQDDAYHAECRYCQEGSGRHSHGFADTDGRLSRSESDTRLYGRQSAVAWIAAQRWIERARQQASEARRTIVPPLTARARAAYPDLARYGFWPHSTLAEIDLMFAADWEAAATMYLPGTAIRPVIEAVVNRVREASDLDMALNMTLGSNEAPLFGSPREAAEMLGLAA